MQGEVVAIGPEAVMKPKAYPIDLKVGDIILFGKWPAPR